MLVITSAAPSATLTVCDATSATPSTNAGPLSMTPSHYRSDRTHTHTHTHPFNGPLSATTRVSPYPKGKANLDFTEARDSEWQWHQLGCMQLCILLQTDNPSRTQPLSFLQAGCPFCCPTNSVKALVMHYKSNFAKNFTVPSFINFQMLHRTAQNVKTRKILSKEV